MSQEALKQKIRENRMFLAQKAQEIYEKHGITVENLTAEGATIKITRGPESLMDAIVEEAELLATLGVNGASANEEPEHVSVEDEPEQEYDDVPPPPPGAKSTGKWVGSWSPRTFTGTYTEE